MTTPIIAVRYSTKKNHLRQFSTSLQKPNYVSESNLPKKKKIISNENKYTKKRDTTQPLYLVFFSGAERHILQLCLVRNFALN